LYLSQQVTKGKPNWNHTVTLDGRCDDEKDLNFVYWLGLHLQQNHNLSLDDFENWNLSPVQENQRLWKWSKDAMRETFKARCKLAGYPAGKLYFIICLIITLIDSLGLLSFHSLRAGFICTAITRAGSDASRVRGVLEHCGLIAGWVPGQKAQMRYIKECQTQTLVATRIVSMGKLKSNFYFNSNIYLDDTEPLVEPDLFTPEGYHHLPPMKSLWTNEPNLRALREEFLQK
jgi:hypothetical protein